MPSEQMKTTSKNINIVFIILTIALAKIRSAPIGNICIAFLGMAQAMRHKQYVIIITGNRKFSVNIYKPTNTVTLLLITDLYL